jgi:hypothetical protein
VKRRFGKRALSYKLQVFALAMIEVCVIDGCNTNEICLPSPRTGRFLAPNAKIVAR